MLGCINKENLVIPLLLDAKHYYIPKKNVIVRSDTEKSRFLNYSGKV